jgi:hypothetical protein
MRAGRAESWYEKQLRTTWEKSSKTEKRTLKSNHAKERESLKRSFETGQSLIKPSKAGQSLEKKNQQDGAQMKRDW